MARRDSQDCTTVGVPASIAQRSYINQGRGNIEAHNLQYEWPATYGNPPAMPVPDPNPQVCPRYEIQMPYADTCSACPTLLEPSGLTSTSSKSSMSPAYESITELRCPRPEDCAPESCIPQICTPTCPPTPRNPPPTAVRPPIPPLPAPCPVQLDSEPDPPYAGPPSPAWYQMQRCRPNVTSPAMRDSIMPCPGVCGRRLDDRFYSIYQTDFCQSLPCGGRDIAVLMPAEGSENVPLGVSVGIRRQYVGRCGGGTSMHGGSGGGPQKRPRRVCGDMGPPPQKYTFGRSEYQAKVSRLGGALLKYQARRCSGPCAPCGPCGTNRPCLSCRTSKYGRCPLSMPTGCCRPPCKPCPRCRPGRPCRSCRPPYT